MSSAYRVKFRPAAERDSERLPREILKRVDSRLLALSENPRPPDVKKLKGRENSWRIRVGDYRVLYEVDDSENLVTVTRVMHRSKAYQSS